MRAYNGNGPLVLPPVNLQAFHQPQQAPTPVPKPPQPSRQTPKAQRRIIRKHLFSIITIFAGIELAHRAVGFYPSFTIDMSMFGIMVASLALVNLLINQFDYTLLGRTDQEH